MYLWTLLQGKVPQSVDLFTAYSLLVKIKKFLYFHESINATCIIFCSDSIIIVFLQIKAI